MVNQKQMSKQKAKNMVLWQIWQKIKMAAVLASFDRYDSNLKHKLLYERALDNYNFCQYMYFPMTVIRLSESKFSEKKIASLIGRILQNLYVTNLILFRLHKSSSIFCNPFNSASEIFWFLRKTSAKKTFLYIILHFVITLK